MITDFVPGELVKIIVHSAKPDTPNCPLKGSIQDFRKKQLLLLADQEVERSADVTAQTKNLLYMGSVLTSFARADGKWDILITVDRTLAML